MADTLWHRGPDDEGVYVSGQVGLGFRRLSIIDLSGGHQPLSNEDGTVWIVFNGEIYNYQELRKFLLAKGHVFRTQSDTEVIVHLYEELGENCVDKLRGMFAFAIWDDRNKLLLLARDRVGIKPLYYYLSEKSLIFGSEIKAILADPEVKPEVLPSMINRFFTFRFLPGEDTLIKNVYKLLPGHCMVVREGKTQIRQYWDLTFPKSELSLEDAEKQLLALLEETVRLHLISDVPVGFLMSGGVDSTALLSFAAKNKEHSLSGYTIGFSDPGVVDERPYARVAAREYGVEHHEMTIGSKDFQEFLPEYVRYMEEPVFEPPAVALYYVSRLAKNHVKVLISGEGGDEAFGGYTVYRNILWLERVKRLLPRAVKVATSAGLAGLNQLLRSSKIAKYGPLIERPFESYYYNGTSLRDGFLDDIDELYSKNFAQTVSAVDPLEAVRKYIENGTNTDLVNRMLYIDTKTWLAHDLLLKADKMTMANSIELRVPFLDHKVMEFAASLPGNFKVRGFQTKYIAKKTLGGLVPREILHRKKAGFPVPYASWMRTTMANWVRDILLDNTALERGFFKKGRVERILAENEKYGIHSKEIFCLTTLELWHRTFLERRPALTCQEARINPPQLVSSK